MKRLLLFTPLLLVLAACGGSQRTSDHPVLSHTARLGDVPLRVDVAGAHRVGRVVAVDLRLANRAPAGADAFSIDDTFSSEGDYDAGGVLLLDSRTGAQATPIAASRADLDLLEVAPGGTQLIRVEFAAPSGDTADVLVPHFGLYRDVPVR